MQGNERIRVGVSACLLGEKVRYDGGHKLDRFIRDTLGRYFHFVPVCPEVECGLPVPRESMHLAGSLENPRLVTTETKVDLTEKMLTWARKKVRELEQEELCGFIFKTGSPSSGLRQIQVFCDDGVVRKQGVGLFARTFIEHFPRVPVEDDGRLHDEGIRENFIERVFTFWRWRNCLKAGKKRGNLVKFHTAHKLLILSHSPTHYRAMGKLVAEAKKLRPTELFDRYEKLLMDALSRKATPAKNANVLHHIMGHFKKELSSWEKEELLDLVERYRRGEVPLIVPITLVKHYVKKYGKEYLENQVYLNPHPIELKLRNHA
ncbi:MAG: DUF1722 domain-containing protein [Deltaproteobacteria bacterium]|nr:MAG: DUF1722 domain-containing protein [Deltaproteobacteria bacterium]